MAQATGSHTLDSASSPTSVEMAEMIDRLDAAYPRPSREELDDLERHRRFAVWVAFGHLEEAA